MVWIDKQELKQELNTMQINKSKLLHELTKTKNKQDQDYLKFKIGNLNEYISYYNKLLIGEIELKEC